MLLVHTVRVKRAFVKRFSIEALEKAVSNIHKGANQVHKRVIMTLPELVQHMRWLPSRVSAESSRVLGSQRV